MPAEDDRLLTPKEVASILSVSVRRVQQMAKAGEIPSLEVGRYRRFRRSSVDQWIEGHERG